MSAAWVPGRGFVQRGGAAIRTDLGRDMDALKQRGAVARQNIQTAPGRAKSSFYGGPGGSLQPPQPQSQQQQPSQPSQQNPNGHHHSEPAGGYTESQRHTIGKPWKPYAELTGMGMDYDRSQYHFPEVAVRNRGGAGRGRNVNRGAGSEAEKQGAQGGQGDHFDPLARQFDMRPPQAIEAGPQRGRLDAGDQPMGALGSGPRVHASYERTPRVIPAGAQGWVEPFGALGMGSQPRTAAASPKAGMAQSGMLRARRNIIAPEQGSTPASMSGRKVIDV